MSCNCIAALTIPCQRCQPCSPIFRNTPDYPGVFKHIVHDQSSNIFCCASTGMTLNQMKILVVLTMKDIRARQLPLPQPSPTANPGKTENSCYEQPNASGKKDAVAANLRPLKHAGWSVPSEMHLLFDVEEDEPPHWPQNNWFDWNISPMGT